MEKTLLTLALAALTIGLLGSCSKMNERIDGLDNRVWKLEQEKIASIENQIAAINSSITDLSAIRKDITDQKAASETLGKRIDTLKAYVGDLSKYAEKDWATALFATLEQLNATKADLETLKVTVSSINSAISALETRISTLEARVSAIEQMIQTVSIIPAYSDGSVEADADGILTLKCVVKPAEALVGMASLKDSLTIYADSVKVKTRAASAYMEISVSEANVTDAGRGAITLKADISGCLPKGEGKALTIALNVKNGVSDYVTEFVPVSVAGPDIPEGALPGVFSVSATKKVYFSKGNLVATIDASGAPTAWKFSTHQYDCLGEGGANKAIGVAAGDVDLFGWSTASTTYGISTFTSSSSYSGDFVDWGKAYCEKNNITPDNTWRTLSEDEWVYLFNNHTKKWASVNGKSGYVIAPDGFTGELASSYADDAALASAGNLVFLPAAGLRYGFFVDDVGDSGFYWSSTASDGDGACPVAFDSDDVYPDDNVYREYGFSVRLITECQ